MSDLKPWLKRLAAREILTADAAEALVAALLGAEPVQQAAALTALHLRGETPDELEGAVRAVRAVMNGAVAPAGAIDVCGTGGDGANTLNISTAVALVVAGCGVPVAKHGNRAASSQSGTADVLSALGVAISPGADGHARSFAQAGMSFFFAPDYHPALVRLAPVRRALGFRTLFNLIGPLVNPARVTRQLIGVFDPAWLEPMARAFAAGGGAGAWLVHGDDGLDELSIAGASTVVALEAGGLRRFRVTPADAGLAAHPIGALAGGAPEHNAAALRLLLTGGRGAYRDAVCLNAAAALVVAGAAQTLPDGAARAGAALDSGAAARTLDRLAAASQAAAA